MQWLLNFSALTMALLATILILNLLIYLCRSTTDFIRWLFSSLKDPHNFPHFLVAGFTLLLAVFAYYAWTESKRGTEALQGQLKAMLSGQRPYLGPGSHLGTPELDSSPRQEGQIVWQFQFRNFGPGLAREIKFRTFIKVGDGLFTPSFGSKNPSTAADMPPSNISVTTAVSPPDLTMTHDRFEALMKTDFSIKVLVELEYEDIYYEKFTSPFCLACIATGAIVGRQPRDCEREKAQ
jgi:hypothetical protein